MASADDAPSQVADWAASGAMALTGGPGPGRLGPPDGLVPELHRIAASLAASTGRLGKKVVVDPIALLGERAAFLRLEPQGQTSCGGATRLLRTRDGWLAVSLARDHDIDLVPAWLELDGPPDDAWAVVERTVAESDSESLVERGALLGLPIALLPGSGWSPAPGRVTGLLGTRSGPPVAPRTGGRIRVVDLTGLWAGPLAGALLAEAGARVIKVESTARRDGARLGPRGFFDLLNGDKQQVALNLRSGVGRDELLRLITDSDVVLEASRPRALEQLGIHADALLRADRGPQVWCSITGHGRHGAGRNRVAFGDDAAVAGGLVAWDDDQPVFLADAVADPICGLIAAEATASALVTGDRGLLDLSMADAAAWFAGPTLPADDVEPDAIAPPRARGAVSPRR